ncbi:MAG: PAS domain S-box protein, partial [Gemmatimonadetes bacterium]|nr:PAS domain S-box protein [Gemmatimonadota bacterium]NIR77867.1 PAS domain S-box protein [Gemmatimonadota bacterium]NIT86412.1 PAS domain S-box protein [Gemmatimonadota bacterium]NIU30249.1 PAS domain S-box protein [Gemmatimonadota bacterium]NIU35155.1 PAS domain S-box protein [Gemmatimonadota bacterium]
YWVLLFVVLGGVLLIRGTPWRSPPGLHTVMETASTFMAAVIGALALVRFYTKKRTTFLFIGTGFVGTALLEAYHAVITSGVISYGTLVAQEDVSAWSWIGSRLFLGLFLYVSWLAWRREQADVSPERVVERSVYVTAAILTALVLGFVAFVPTSRAYYPELAIHRPAEFLPACFFLLAVGGYLWKGRWRRDPFEHWLVISLLLGALAHLAYMPFSEGLHDAPFDVAHLLKVASHMAVLTGLLWSVYATFRREAIAMEEIQVANDALAREVAVRRRAERVLQESEERLQDFLDNANDLIQSTAPDGTILYVNRAWLRTLGYPEDEVAGESLWEFLDSSSVERCRDAFDRALEGESVTGIELEFLDAEGNVVLCSGSANARFENGKPVAIRSIFRDVTEQRRVEREMAASRANLQALVESTGDAIWSVNREHQLITFNSAFGLAMEARTGREPRRGDPPERVFREEEVPWYREQYERALGGERFS